MTALCVRQAVRQGVQGSRQVCAGTEGQLLLLLPWRPRDCPSAARTHRPLREGLPAQRHRSASLTEEEPASREAPQQHIAASSKRLPWQDAVSI